jgi:hypothetical protein
VETIDFNVDSADALPYITAILMQLPVRTRADGGTRNAVKFNREGNTYTLVGRLPGERYVVSFRNRPEHADTRYYRNATDAARAVITGEHDYEHSEPGRDHSEHEAAAV